VIKFPVDTTYGIGIALACHAPVKSKQGLYAVRFLLGLVSLHAGPTQANKHISDYVTWQFEAGMFPGVVLQMTYWYRPDEMSLRLLYFCEYSLLICTSFELSTDFVDILGNLSGVVSGVLAFAFSHLDGAHGLSGWQWLFLCEAIITIVFGTALYWILPDCMHSTLAVLYPNRLILY
jgi:hypothetical protein